LVPQFVIKIVTVGAHRLVVEPDHFKPIGIRNIFTVRIGAAIVPIEAVM
jgi:hypothetical protein